jgi:glc operon protein GlcG
MIPSSSTPTIKKGDAMLRRLIPLLALVAMLPATNCAAAELVFLATATISADAARKVAAATIAEARKNGWLMAVAVTDPNGDLVYFEKMDGTQIGSVKVSIGKSRTAALFKRPSKVFQDSVASGGEGLRVMTFEGLVAAEGGLPLFADGKFIGAVGGSGGTSQQDGVACKAGADILK